MSSIYLEIEKFRNKQLLDKLEKQIKDINSDDEKEIIKKKIEDLKPKDKTSASQKSLDEMFKEYDKNQFKQPWRYLTSAQKEIKLLEYDKNIDKKLLNELKSVNRRVKYSPTEEKITQILSK